MCYWGTKARKHLQQSTFFIVFSAIHKFYEEMNKCLLLLSAQVKNPKFSKRPGLLFKSLRRDLKGKNVRIKGSKLDLNITEMFYLPPLCAVSKA